MRETYKVGLTRGRYDILRGRYIPKLLYEKNGRISSSFFVVVV